jgi:hypothetical protein
MEKAVPAIFWNRFDFFQGAEGLIGLSGKY